jgi:hypothetical protein
MLNLNNLLSNYSTSNQNLNNVAGLNLENPLYPQLINLINSGTFNPESISLLRNNLNEVIKTNLINSNNLFNIISSNQENSDYKDQQANMIEIGKNNINNVIYLFIYFYYLYIK